MYKVIFALILLLSSPCRVNKMKNNNYIMSISKNNKYSLNNYNDRVGFKVNYLSFIKLNKKNIIIKKSDFYSLKREDIDLLLLHEVGIKNNG